MHLATSRLAFESREISAWLSSLRTPVVLVFSLDAALAPRRVRPLLRGLSRLQSVTSLALTLPEHPQLSPSQSFNYFRWLHSFSIASEGFFSSWHRRYSYDWVGENQAAKVVRQNHEPLAMAAVTRQVSVIIPHHCDFENLKTVLLHLSKQTLASADFDVLIVDNGQTSQILDPQKQQELAPFLQDLNFQFLQLASASAELFLSGQARNLGLRHSRGAIVQFLDSDILLPPTYLTDLIAQMETEDVVMAKREMLKPGRRPQVGEGLDSNAVYEEDRYWENFKRAEQWMELPEFWKYACTYSLAVKREFLNRAGPFDPRFTTYGFEDVDLSFRLYKLGARFAFAKARVYHLFPQRDEHNYHLNSERRQQALTRSALTLFLGRPEQETFALAQGYFAPTLRQWVRSFIPENWRPLAPRVRSSRA